MFKTKIQNHQLELTSSQTLLNSINSNIEKTIENRKQKATLWQEENQKEFKNSNICSECGQTYPQEKLDNLLETFNTAKLNKLEAIEKEGIGLKETENNLIADLNKTNLFIDEKQKFIKDLESQLKEQNVLLSNLPELSVILSENKDYQQLLESKKSVEEIPNLQEPKKPTQTNIK